ncbi:DNA-binding protein (plasmid) [Enterobacter hormaechei]|uniref:helix-turn-helix domain-containing protein n=1 Tax=Enterobacter hormaechei TaxID=158836 RepID=UPI000DBF13DC|nr:helix-turn-helix transcriptional regulator [Enterobacter hormaechei]AWX05546.1 DNA-binding protein [Enterobacter hormaechei]RAM40202.1 DNA-binding protein [Enterobacter hormaechei]
MPRVKLDNFTVDQIREAYDQAGNLSDMAKSLGISYATASAWTNQLGIKTKRQGYTAPRVAISGAQCRHAREYLGMTRDEFCAASSVGKTAVRQFELGQSTPRRATLDKIMKLFDRYGIVFQSDGTFQ